MGAWCGAIVEPLVGGGYLRGCTSGENGEAQHIASWVFCNIIGDPNYLIGDLPDLESGENIHLKTTSFSFFYILRVLGIGCVFSECGGNFMLLRKQCN